MKLQVIVAGNVEVLEQGAKVLEHLSPGTYAAPHPAVCATGIGGMVRHVLDFYACLLAGLDSGCVDYDARERNVQLERDVRVARQRIAETIVALRGLAADGADAPLRVRAEDVASDGQDWSHSSLARELTFLLSHTVHHYALIAVMLRLTGIEPPTGFGVAFSTLMRQGSKRAHAG